MAPWGTPELRDRFINQVIAFTDSVIQRGKPKSNAEAANNFYDQYGEMASQDINKGGQGWHGVMGEVQHFMVPETSTDSGTPLESSKVKTFTVYPYCGAWTRHIYRRFKRWMKRHGWTPETFDGQVVFMLCLNEGWSKGKCWWQSLEEIKEFALYSQRFTKGALLLVGFGNLVR